MDEFGESLPSESILVTNHSNNKSQNVFNLSTSLTSSQTFIPVSNSNRERHENPKPFLKKGSRKEPSALIGTIKHSQNSNNIHYQHHEEDKGSILESSLVSTSDLLGDTTNSEIYNKWLEDQRIAKLELDEFEMIERDVDNMAVTPLLMSVDGKIGGIVNQNPQKDGIKQLHHQHQQSQKSQQPQSNRNHNLSFQSKWVHQSADYFMSNPRESNSIPSSQNNSRKMENQRYSHENDNSFDSSHGDYQNEDDMNYYRYKQQQHQHKNYNNDDNEIEDDDHKNKNHSYHNLEKLSVKVKNDLYVDNEDNQDDEEVENNNDEDNLDNDDIDDDHNKSNESFNGEQLRRHDDDDNEDEDEEEEEEESSSILISDTQFLRISQNPFVDNSTKFSTPNSNYHSSKVPLSSVDDSLSWAVDNRQSAIRPKLQSSNEEVVRSNSVNNNNNSRSSSANLRYQTTHYSSGAIGESDSDWNNKRLSTTSPLNTNKKISSSVMNSSTTRKSIGNQKLNDSGTLHFKNQQNQQSELSKSKNIQNEDIINKAKKLEEEIAAFQKEKLNMKNMKKQQEIILKELQEKEAQMKIWAEEEKKKVEKWCEEQKEVAKKEKRAAAQYLRDARNSSLGTSVRKEKSEIEALQATITKMTLEHTETTKKLKANIVRLQQTNKKQIELINQLETRVATLELEKMKLTTIKGPNNSQQSNSKSSSKNKLSTSRSRMEEVEIEDDPVDNIYNVSRVTQNHIYSSQSIKNNSKRKDYFGCEDDENEEEEEGDYVNEEENEENEDDEENEDEDIYVGSNNNDNNDIEDQNEDENENEEDQSLVEFGTTDIPPLYHSSTNTPIVDKILINTTNKSSELQSSSSSINNRSLKSSQQSQQPPPYSEDLNKKLSYDPNRYSPTTSLLNQSNDSNNRKSPFQQTRISLSESQRTSVQTSISSSTDKMKSSSEKKNTPIQKETIESPQVTNPLQKDRVVEIGPNGLKTTRYSNGTIKYLYPDGISEVRFTNGDIKRQNPHEGTLVYFYSQAKTTHTTYPDGTEVYEFPTGQIEKHFPNGQKVVTFPDHTIKTIYSDGYQESIFPDGVIVKEYPNGKREVETK